MCSGLTSRWANKTWPWFGCGRSFSDVTFLCLPFFLVLLHYNSRLNLPVRLSRQARAIYLSFDWSTMRKILSRDNFCVIDVKLTKVQLLEKNNCLIPSKRWITAIKQLIFDCKLKWLLKMNCSSPSVEFFKFFSYRSDLYQSL